MGTRPSIAGAQTLTTMPVGRTRLKTDEGMRPPSTPAVPYVATWSRETAEPPRVIERPGRGIAYWDEILADRDKQGVLWDRVTVCPGRGTPQFADIHTHRQRRAMRRLLCQVCAGPADETEDGVLWLLSDTITDSPDWPDNLVAADPPHMPAVCPVVGVRLPTVEARPRRPAGPALA
ncbi:hypothetical protein DFQ13_103521 [Actinokineospora spheciospongiae]|nr:hypothetical protein DFQ13_103521 [Actinokineospora spheciospongiae]